MGGEQRKYIKMEAEAYVSASRLYMLRAIIALAHTDGVLELDEVELLNDIVKNEPLAPGQREMLVREIYSRKNVCFLKSLILKIVIVSLN